MLYVAISMIILILRLLMEFADVTCSCCAHLHCGFWVRRYCAARLYYDQLPTKHSIFSYKIPSLDSAVMLQLIIVSAREMGVGM